VCVCVCARAFARAGGRGRVCMGVCARAVFYPLLHTLMYLKYILNHYTKLYVLNRLLASFVIYN